MLDVLAEALVVVELLCLVALAKFMFSQNMVKSVFPVGWITFVATVATNFSLAMRGW
jgi:hypothetical protein